MSRLLQQHLQTVLVLVPLMVTQQGRILMLLMVLNWSIKICFSLQRCRCRFLYRRYDSFVGLCGEQQNWHHMISELTKSRYSGWKRAASTDWTQIKLGRGCILIMTSDVIIPTGANKLSNNCTCTRFYYWVWKKDDS